jgi:tRNA pseudouridine55 synthase
VGRSGVVVVDKPAGLTSHDVVARIRRMAGTRRVGHAGTLDPMATGVLVVGVQRATRLLHYVIGSTKGYRATVRLGQATSTDDAEGELVAQRSAAGLTEPGVREALRGFLGSIQQVPSAVSAIKVGGVRAYARVRAGEAVTLAARTVTVDRLDLTDVRGIGTDLVDLDIDVLCSAGTYVRALARDLGSRLGCGGHLTALRRTTVGPFAEAEALSLDDLAERTDPVMLSLAEAATRCLPRRDADAEQARVLGHGGPLPAVGLTGPYAVFGPDGDVIAVVVERAGLARPEAVLAPAGGGGDLDPAGEE